MAEIIYKEESYKIIGACFSVYNEVRLGFAEPVYQECTEMELERRGMQPRISRIYTNPPDCLAPTSRGWTSACVAHCERARKLPPTHLPTRLRRARHSAPWNFCSSTREKHIPAQVLLLKGKGVGGNHESHGFTRIPRNACPRLRRGRPRRVRPIASKLAS